VIGLQDEMTRLEDQAWYCSPHALVVVAEDLVGLYRSRGDANWTLITEILGETLPGLLLKAKNRLTGLGARPP
jgi:hypothetical protein